MTVEELIQILKAKPQRATVVLHVYNHTYNSDYHAITHGSLHVTTGMDVVVLSSGKLEKRII